MPSNYLYQRVSATETDCTVQVVMAAETQHSHDDSGHSHHNNRAAVVDNSDLILERNHDVDGHQSIQSSVHSHHQQEMVMIAEQQHQHRHDHVYGDETTVTVSASVVTSQTVPPDECCQHTTSTLLGSDVVETHTNTNRSNHTTHCTHTLML